MNKWILIILVLICMGIPTQGGIYNFEWCSFEAPDGFTKITIPTMAQALKVEGSKWEQYVGFRLEPEGTTSDTLNRWVRIMKGGKDAEVNLYEDVDGIQGETLRATIDGDNIGGALYVWRPSENIDLVLYGVVDDPKGVTTEDKDRVRINADKAYTTFKMLS